MSNSFQSNSAGTAIYYKQDAKVEILSNPAADEKLRSRVTAACINKVWYGEFYSPTSSENADVREEFYAYANEVIRKMRDRDAARPMIIMGDFNTHIAGHCSPSTNDNGKLLQKLE